MRALLVEDDAPFAAAAQHLIRQDGGVVDHVESGEEAIDLVRHYQYDVMILDFSLPDLNGIEVIRRIRSIRSVIPIIVISSCFGKKSRVEAFTQGADDIIAKPFDTQEFKERLYAIIRRSRGFCQSTIEIHNVKLILGTKRVFINDDEVHLTNKEYAILELLILRRGSIVAKETFLDHLYNSYDEPEAKIIDVFICKLRKKFAKFGQEGFIKTVWGQGYSICAD